MKTVTEQSDLRLTPQRRVILDELRGVRTHPTADEVYELVRRRMPRISLGTVYRNLEILAGLGLIRKLEVAGKQKRFDADLVPHHHVRCVACGRVGDVFSADLGDLAGAFQGHTDYTIIGHRLELLGYCPSCRAAQGHANGRQPAADRTTGACADARSENQPSGTGGTL